MPRGHFVTFEGLDGSGKSTQIKRLAAWFERLDGSAGALSGPGARLVLTRQPGGTETGERIRGLVLDSRSTGLAPRAELALMFADRAQSIEEVIEPGLAAGKIVVCDRFTDSTEAYQGGGRELGSEIVLELDRLICGGLKPDLTLLLLPSLEASLRRARRRNERVAKQSGKDEGRFELEQDAFHCRVWEKYREIAAREPCRVELIEGDLGIDEVHGRVIAAVTRLIGVEARA